MVECGYMHSSYVPKAYRASERQEDACMHTVDNTAAVDTHDGCNVMQITRSIRPWEVVTLPFKKLKYLAFSHRTLDAR